MLRLGLIGMSDGNGHPYSWAAIINGYNKEVMETCPFRAIPAYLERQSFPRDQIRGAEVTHIWTQDNVLSHHIARASKIPNVVSHVTDMLGKVDGILLARDDAENHYAIAKPFLEAGLPIYIDKPVALNIQSLNKIFNSAMSPSQIFSCSALRYAKEIIPSGDELEKIGDLRGISATTPKSWEKYAVHLVDPIMSFLLPKKIISKEVKRLGCATEVILKWDSEIESKLYTTGEDFGHISFRYEGNYGHIDKTFSDSFGAFKGGLMDFINGISMGTSFSSYERLSLLVDVLDLGDSNGSK